MPMLASKSIAGAKSKLLEPEIVVAVTMPAIVNAKTAPIGSLSALSAITV